MSSSDYQHVDAVSGAVQRGHQEQAAFGRVDADHGRDAGEGDRRRGRSGGCTDGRSDGRVASFGADVRFAASQHVADASSVQLDAVKGALAERIGREACVSHFSNVQWVLSGSALALRVGSTFRASMLEKRFGDAVRQAAHAVLGSIDVVFEVPDKASGARALATPLAEAQGRVAPAQAVSRTVDGTQASTQASKNAGGHASLSAGHKTSTNAGQRTGMLDAFVVGDSNALAYNAAIGFADGMLADVNGGQGGALFLHGVCGIGKTHLMRGVAERFKRANPGGRVMTTSGDAFTTAYVNAIKTNAVEALRRKMRGVDLLCIDDVHVVSRRTATQAELVQTIDAITQAGTRVVFVSDEHPRRIAELSKSLQSRFLSGLVVEIGRLDPGLCVKLVRVFAERRGLILEAGAAQRIADFVLSQGGSAREIEGVVTTLDAACRLLGLAGGQSRVTAAVVDQALGMSGRRVPVGSAHGTSMGGGNGSSLAVVRLDDIVDQACLALDVDLGQVRGTGRHPRVVLVRSIVSVLGRELTTHSFPDLARALGRTTHSTIIAAKKRLDAKFESGAARDEMVEVRGERFSIQELCDRVRSGAYNAAGR